MRIKSKNPTSIYSPLGQRVLGLVYILQGLDMLVRGKYSSSILLKYVVWGARYKHNRRERS